MAINLFRIKIYTRTSVDYKFGVMYDSGAREVSMGVRPRGKASTIGIAGLTFGPVAFYMKWYRSYHADTKSATWAADWQLREHRPHVIFSGGRGDHD